jgi:hypothetical protein
MWANHERSVDETADWIANRNRPAINSQALQAQVQALSAENANLRERLTVYHENYARLKEWADRAEAELARLRAAKA